MTKCLIIKLNGQVDNNNLYRIGELRIKFSKVTSPTDKSQGISVSFIKDTKLEILGDGYFTDQALSANKGKTITVPANTLTKVYVSNSDLYLCIMDKYALASLSFTPLLDDTTGYYAKNKELNLEELKYSTRISKLVIYSSKAYGDVSSLKNLTNLSYVRMDSTDISGDISSLKNLTNLTYLEIGFTNVSGNISALSNMTNLTYLGADSTAISGDVSSLERLVKIQFLMLRDVMLSGDVSALGGMTSCLYLYVSGVSGNITSFSRLTKVNVISLTKSTISGDLAGIPSSCVYVDFAGSNTTLTWSSRPSSANIFGVTGEPKINNVDNMLKDLANCVSKITSSSPAFYKIISATGTRTSASDAAVKALQQKGYTVSVTPA